MATLYKNDMEVLGTFAPGRVLSEFEAWADLMMEMDENPLAVSRRTLCARWNWKEDKVRRFLRTLEQGGLAKVERVERRGMLISYARNRAKSNKALPASRPAFLPVKLLTDISLNPTEHPVLHPVLHPDLPADAQMHYLESNCQSLTPQQIASIGTAEYDAACHSGQDVLGGTLTEGHRAFAGFVWWLRENAPYCSDPTHLTQMTLSDFTRLREQYGFTSQEIRDCIMDLENSRDRRKTYVSLSRTILNWLQRRRSDKNGTTGKR